MSTSLTLVSDNTLVTVEELAEKYGVNKRTMYRWLADVEIEPVEFKINPQGRQTPAYKLSKCDAALSHLEAQRQVNQLSPEVRTEIDSYYKQQYNELLSLIEDYKQERAALIIKNMSLLKDIEHLQYALAERDELIKLAIPRLRSYNRNKR
jgi:predicted ArsR family transcriptional regulator